MKRKNTLPCINPATGEQFATVPMATAEDVTQAHHEMRQNFEVWSRKSSRERAQILGELQRELVEQADEITKVVNQDTGKSRQDALAELFLVVDKLKTYRKHAPKWLARKRVAPGIYVFKKYYTMHRPYGVAAVIGPWNFPLDLTIPPVFAALLAGNTVIVKPSEVTPAVGALIERLFQSCPRLAPFVRVLHGDGVTGAALVASKPDVVFLTGSVETGRKVARATAANMTPFISELGGKDPMLVLEDANIPAAAHWGVWGAFFHSGQTCVSVERVYVMDRVYDQFVTEVLVESRKLRMGYSPELQNANDIGPLTLERQAQMAEDHLQDALSKGARILLGGKRDRLYVEPTVVVDVDHSMKLMRDETFGPIMPIMKVKSEAEAIRLANDSHYGLSASVWSEDLTRAECVARELEVGSVVVNDTIAHYAVTQLPFGGVRQSGSARTHGKQDVLQFTQIRAYGVGRVPHFLDVAAKLREPNNYSLMRAIFHALFGVTPQQRLRALPDAAAYVTGRAYVKPAPESFPKRVHRPSGSRVALAGAVAGFMALVLATRRRRQ